MKDIIPKLIYLLYQKYILSNPHYRIKQLRTPEQANESDYYALDFIGLAQLQGREVEWHNVTTDDGYVLSIFRLLPKYALNNETCKRPVIYLQHPLAGDADVYTVFGPGRSLAYTLSDAGYDVWFGNCRGTTYSRQHVTLSPDDSNFWDFSMDEYALVDLPTMIDYVLEVTGEKKISYAGHSLGTTMAFMLLSTKVNYNDKLNAVVLLAPIAYWKTKNAAKYVFTVSSKLLHLLPRATEFEVQSCATRKIFEAICLINSITIRLCRIPFHIVFGNDDEQWSPDQSPKLFCYFPTGLSTKVLHHYSQHVISGSMHYYDFGDKESNMKHYGVSEPPSYNVSRITAPLILLRGERDTLNTEVNNEELIRRLPKSTVAFSEVIGQFNHGDFVLAKDVEKLAYRRILEILRKIL